MTDLILLIENAIAKPLKFYPFVRALELECIARGLTLQTRLTRNKQTRKYLWVNGFVHAVNLPTSGFSEGESGSTGAGWNRCRKVL